MIRDLVASLRARVAASPDRSVAVLLAVMATVPMLLTRPGQISADTKSYLTIDPAALMARVGSMWDPSVGAGTVTHQNIGYLFPLGPYYWLLDAVGAPGWLAQRLLWSAMVFAAAYGTYRLARWWSWHPAPALVAAIAYGFTPYLLSYLARLSVILGPWSAMPWMVLLAAQAVRTRSWRPAAWFAIIVALVGSVNATALVLAGLAPLVWIAADLILRRAGLRAVTAGATRIGLLCVAVSAWWIAGLGVQGRYGIPILRYTETYDAIASGSTAPEVLRGLGYWYFYGGDRLDPWVDPSSWYVDHAAMMLLGFTLVAISLLGLLTSFTNRAFAVALLLVGLVVSVGAAPLDSSTLYGSLFETFTRSTTAGSALRSTTRAAPLVVLALALGLGAFTMSAQRWLTRRRTAQSRPIRSTAWVPTLAIVLLIGQMAPWFAGGALSRSLLRDERLPDHQLALAAWIDGAGADRVYSLPGADFAHHRWGGTVDPVLPGLVERPMLYRELIPQGGDGTSDLLNAFERRLSEGWFEPATLAPVAALFGVDTVVVQNDLEHERFRLARPGALWTDVTSVLGAPDHAGPLVTDTPVIPMIDELALARPTAEEFPVVAGFVLDPAPLLTLRPTTTPMIVAGSGDGVVDLAAAGLLDRGRPLLYAATLDDLAAAGADPDELIAAGERWWVVTDTNRRQGRRWSTIGANLGALEAADALLIDRDPADNRLELFDDTIDEQTIAVHRGEIISTRASYYGNRIAYTPEDAPWHAVDGDPGTAWRAGVFDEAIGLVWEVEYARPVRAPSMTLLQPITGVVDRYITELRVTLDDESFDVSLDDSSRALPGQTIELPDRAFTTLRLEVLMDNLGRRNSYAALPGVGLAMVVVDDIVDDRVVRTPGIVGPNLRDLGVAPRPDERLTFVLTRQRIDPATPNRTPPERRIVREFELDSPRAFTLSGDARISGDVPDDLLADLFGVGTFADRRLPGSPGSLGAAATDGDPTTAWRTPFGDATGSRLVIEFDEAAGIDGTRVDESMTVSWIDDGRHSVPLEVVVDDGRSIWTLRLDPDQTVDGIASSAHPLPGLGEGPITLTITEIDHRTTPEYFSRLPQTMPVAISEVSLDGRTSPRLTDIDTGCRDDLIALDGVPVSVRVHGTSADALARGPLSVELCGDTLELDPGVHRLDTRDGRATGLDLDRLVLDSVGVSPDVGRETGAPEIVELVDVVESSSTEISALVPPTPEPVWLTMRQSHNPGWQATLDGVDLGPPVLIDGYANGWQIPASSTVRSLELRWTPQRSVQIGILVSALAALGCLALLLATRRHRPPVFELGRAGRGTRRSARAGLGRPVVVVPAVVGTMAVVGGLPGAATALLTLLTPDRHRRRVAAIVIVSLWTLVAVGITGIQWRRRYPPGPGWPSLFAWASPLTWAVIGVVVALVVAEGCRISTARWFRRNRTAGPPDAAG